MAKAKYVLMPKLLTPEVDPGKTIELEIYLTGGGVPEQNKLYITYPSAIIDKENPGEFTSSIRTILQKSTKTVIRLISGEKCLAKQPCDPYGATFRLGPGFFLPIPNENLPWFEMNSIMAERKWDDHAPLLVTLNTDKEAQSGDQDIRLALSYVSGGDVEIAKDIVKVHITNWLERHGRSALIVTVFLGILSVVAAYLALLPKQC
jgi:hypothetical protein